MKDYRALICLMKYLVSASLWISMVLKSCDSAVNLSGAISMILDVELWIGVE